MSFTPGHPANA
ncbi:hypothetical protein C358_00897, partial [Cryptococcus neoformans MW-RSA852]